MVHVGETPLPLTTILDELRPGDVLTQALDPSLRERVPGMVATYDVAPAAPVN